MINENLSSRGQDIVTFSPSDALNTLAPTLPIMLLIAFFITSFRPDKHLHVSSSSSPVCYVHFKLKMSPSPSWDKPDDWSLWNHRGYFLKLSGKLQTVFIGWVVSLKVDRGVCYCEFMLWRVKRRNCFYKKKPWRATLLRGYCALA